MSLKAIAYSFTSLVVIIAVIALFWFLLWKFVLEPDPLIRDFFDLDIKAKGRVKKDK
jgi:type IV secretory pathway TrbL component